MDFIKEHEQESHAIQTDKYRDDLRQRCRRMKINVAYGREGDHDEFDRIQPTPTLQPTKEGKPSDEAHTNEPGISTLMG